MGSTSGRMMRQGDEGTLPAHILNLMCAVHLRQDHGYKGWSIGRFEAHFPGLRSDNEGFSFAALHFLHHVDVARLPINDTGLLVAYISLDLARPAT
jgi:hypothetical protein